MIWIWDIYGNKTSFLVSSMHNMILVDIELYFVDYFDWHWNLSIEWFSSRIQFNGASNGFFFPPGPVKKAVKINQRKNALENSCVNIFKFHAEHWAQGYPTPTERSYNKWHIHQIRSHSGGYDSQMKLNRSKTLRRLPRCFDFFGTGFPWKLFHVELGKGTIREERHIRREGSVQKV